MFLSTLSFSLANVFVKLLSDLPAMEIVLFRCTLGVFFCYAGMKRTGIDWRGSNKRLLFLRGFFGTSALFLFFLTLKNLPLALAMTIQYLAPIFTSVFAIFLLREKLSRLQIVFYAIAFAGVLLIERFDEEVSITFLLFGIVSAMCSGVAYNLVRRLREREHPLTVVFHFQLFGMIAGLIAILFVWKTPVGWHWLYLILIGVFSQLGQVFLTKSLQRERASNVAIINYTGLIYAIAIGWFIFSETLSPATYIGMLLVVMGVLLSVVRSNRQNLSEENESRA